MTIEPIPAFNDNYFWLINQGQQAIVVDPGEANVVLSRLENQGLTLHAIFVTHKHYDHIGGVEQLKAETGCQVISPPIEGLSMDHVVHDNETISAFGEAFHVIAVPGHTLEHVAYFSESLKACFVGDTLFSSGCGRMFEGTPEQFLTSLKRLVELPDDTKIYCAHEYTLANLDFALTVEPKNSAISLKLAKMKALRTENKPTLPTTIGDEKITNPFLRTKEADIVEAVTAHTGRTLSDEVAVFHALRSWKDNF
ncbi:MAG: hydroxyacylglutathione hydrolase [Cellvibrionales bacterium]|nr:hydroxyacylglutathione hydrolase [Cellvibrionales bacterium]